MRKIDLRRLTFRFQPFLIIGEMASITRKLGIFIFCCLLPSITAWADPLTLEDHYQAFSARYEDIRDHAHCLNQETLSEDDLLRRLNAYAGKGSPGTFKIFGIDFQNESPAMLKLFDKLTNWNWHYERVIGLNQYFHDYYEYSNGEYRTDYYAYILKNSGRLSDGCHKVICAAQSLFGQKEGLQLLYLLAQYGFNGSYIPFPRAIPWTAERLDIILTALSNYPDFMYRDIHNWPLYKRLKEKEDDITDVSNNVIEVFDGVWDTAPTYEKWYYILHEVAHIRGALDGLQSSNAWTQLGGWSAEPTSFNIHGFKFKIGFYSEIATVTSHPERIISERAKDSIAEDWAESVVAYRLNPQLLLSRSREKYDYIRYQVFQNHEYLNGDECGETGGPSN